MECNDGLRTDAIERDAHRPERRVGAKLTSKVMPASDGVTPT